MSRHHTISAPNAIHVPWVVSPNWQGRLFVLLDALGLRACSRSVNPLTNPIQPLVRATLKFTNPKTNPNKSQSPFWIEYSNWDLLTQLEPELRTSFRKPPPWLRLKLGACASSWRPPRRKLSRVAYRRRCFGQPLRRRLAFGQIFVELQLGLGSLCAAFRMLAAKVFVHSPCFRRLLTSETSMPYIYSVRVAMLKQFVWL